MQEIDLNSKQTVHTFADINICMLIQFQTLYRNNYIFT